MNWYKKSIEENNNISDWNFPEAEHDYNPNWDYEIDPVPDSQLMKIAEDALQNINTNVIPEIGMGKAKNAYVKWKDKDALAKYVFGTAPYPVFVVNLELVKKSATQYNVNIGVAIESTLLHELGHAIQDWMGMEMDENQAEDFAFEYITYKQINKFWENSSKRNI